MPRTIIRWRPAVIAAVLGRQAVALKDFSMDDIVKQALVKWPNVPDCYGWLGLDARGNWFLRDDATQALGVFPAHKGSLLQHAKLIDFIGRNYEADARGCWYFQNGPQRVYVELESAPVVWRVEPSGSVRSHTGLLVEDTRALVDEHGRVYLDAAGLLGVVHTQDMVHVADLLEQGHWVLEEVQAASLAPRFHFVLSPLTLDGTAVSSHTVEGV